jgi:hypothetical protein
VTRLAVDDLCHLLLGRDRREAVGVLLVQLSRVLLQVKVAAESLVADLAREGLLLVVRVHVERQVVNLESEQKLK